MNTISIYGLTLFRALQIPPFLLLSSTLRSMANVHWPGLDCEGALWFKDLTLQAMVMDTGGWVHADWGVGRLEPLCAWLLHRPPWSKVKGQELMAQDIKEKQEDWSWLLLSASSCCCSSGMGTGAIVGCYYSCKVVVCG